MLKYTCIFVSTKTIKIIDMTSNSKKIETLLTKGLAKTGNGFRTTLSNLICESNMTEIEVIMALNTITCWNAWDMIID